MSCRPRPARVLAQIVVIVVLCLGSAAAARAGAAAPVTVRIIAFNDFHGHLESPGAFGRNALVPERQRPATGGADALAAAIATLRVDQPASVVVGAGDFIGASPLVSALHFDEPAVEVLNRMGVDFTSVGNHEFDHGAAELLRLQHGGCRRRGAQVEPGSCKGYGSSTPGTFDGAHYRWLAANVIDEGNGAPLLPPYGLKTLAGVRVAFIGLTLQGTAGIVVPSGVAGLRFQDEADTVNALVPRLRTLGAAAIVVLIHQGGMQTRPVDAAEAPLASDINGCTGDLKNADGGDSPLRAIVGRLDDGVDLVISGHTHAAYNCSATTVDVRGTTASDSVETARPAGLPKRTGRPVPVTSASAFGRVITSIDLRIDPATRHVLGVSPRNRLVDRSDPAIAASLARQTAEGGGVGAVVAAYRAAAAPLAGVVLGTITAPLGTTPDAAGEMPAGDLLADAQLHATQAADTAARRSPS